MKIVKLKKLAKRILTKYSDGHYTQFAGHENIIMAMKECAKDYHKQKMEEMMPKSKKLSNRKELSLWNYWDATTSEDRVDIVERAFKMIEAQKKYIELLSEELDELAVLAHSRGWRSKRAEQGEQMNYFTGNLSGWVIPNT